MPPALINELEVIEALGGWLDYCATPKPLADKVRLILAARRKVEREREEEAEEEKRKKERDERLRKELYG